VEAIPWKNEKVLKNAIDECRVVKDRYEVALIRQANLVSDRAHIAVMKAVKHAKNERDLEALFTYTAHINGCKEQAYSCICGSGTNAATLHYIKNDLPLDQKLNFLIDAGAEHSCYASDVTRTFPINGKFTKESRNVYDAVLKMQLECIEMLKDNVLWDDVHAHAHKVAIAELVGMGVLKGDVEEIFNARTSAAFFPHGLGHYLGMDTHDTGGNANYEDEDPMFKYLRVRGRVPAGAVITVEPGVSFAVIYL
jgi:Xaa-Pro dipeptidase